MAVKDLLVDLSGMGCRTLGKWANLMIYPELRVRARLLDDQTLKILSVFVLNSKVIG
jgi:hypothetical protein